MPSFNVIQDTMSLTDALTMEKKDIFFPILHYIRNRM